MNEIEGGISSMTYFRDLAFCAIAGTAGGPAPLGTAPLAAAGLLAFVALMTVWLRARRRPTIAGTHDESSTTTKAEPAAELLAPGRGVGPALCEPAGQESVAWLAGAFRSLAARPIWDGEVIAHPVFARLTEDWLEVDVSEADPMAAPLPWVDLDTGRRWRLMRSTPLGRLPATDVSQPMPAIVAVGAGLLVNLEGVGVLTIDGEFDEAMGLVRSIVDELGPSNPGGATDVRSTFAITGIGTQGIVRRQSPDELMAELPGWLDDVEAALRARASCSAYSHRLTGADSIVPIVIVTDPVGARDMPIVLEAATQRRLPIAVLVVGGFAEPGEAAVRLGAAQAATLEPWGIEFSPRHTTATVGRKLSELADKSRPRRSSHRGARSRRMPAVPASHRRGSSQRSRRTRRTPMALAIGPEPPNWPIVTEDPTPQASGEPIAAEIGVLGRVELVGLDIELTSQQLSLLTFVACHPDATRDTIVEALWDGQAISKRRFPNLLAETRAKVGRNVFPEAREGRYRLVGIGTDLNRFEQLVDEAANAATDGDAARWLRDALTLVRGVPFTPPSARFWSWVTDRGHVAARLESVAADTAARLARIELADRDSGAARWACEQGLLASPADQTLVTILAEIYVQAGKSALATRLVDTWEDHIRSLGCGEPSVEPRERLASLGQPTVEAGPGRRDQTDCTVPSAPGSAPPSSWPSFDRMP